MPSVVICIISTSCYRTEIKWKCQINVNWAIYKFNSVFMHCVMLMFFPYLMHRQLWEYSYLAMQVPPICISYNIVVNYSIYCELHIFGNSLIVFAIVIHQLWQAIRTPLRVNLGGLCGLSIYNGP